MKRNLALDYSVFAGGGGGGGGGYGSASTEQQSSGGKNVASFGAINFGSNSSLGGASAGMSEGGSNTMLYVLIGAGVLLFLFKR